MPAFPSCRTACRAAWIALCAHAGAAWAGDAAVADAVEIALDRRETGTYYTQAHIEGYGNVSMLVDTGSSFSVINAQMLEVLLAAGHARFDRELRGHMADGSQRAVPLYRIASLRLHEHCVLRDVEVAVVPGNTRAILGMDVLADAAPFEFHARPPRLRLAGCAPRAADFAAAETLGSP